MPEPQDENKKTGPSLEEIKRLLRENPNEQAQQERAAVLEAQKNQSNPWHEKPQVKKFFEGMGCDLSQAHEKYKSPNGRASFYFVPFAQGSHPEINSQNKLGLIVKVFNQKNFTRDDTLRVSMEIEQANRYSDVPGFVKTHFGQFYERDSVLIMENCEGGDLVEMMIFNQQRPTLSEIENLIGQLGGALVTMHEDDNYHRDIKPSNVLLRTSDYTQAVWSDLEISSFMAKMFTGLQRSGSLYYMPPYNLIQMEQGDDKIDYLLGDLYAFASTVYQFFTRAEEPLPFGQAQLDFFDEWVMHEDELDTKGKLRRKPLDRQSPMVKDFVSNANNNKYPYVPLAEIVKLNDYGPDEESTYQILTQVDQVLEQVFRQRPDAMAYASMKELVTALERCFAAPTSFDEADNSDLPPTGDESDDEQPPAQKQRSWFKKAFGR